MDFYRRYGKRVFDAVFSLLGLLLLSPLLALIALVVKCSSPGGAFFLQERIGLEGKTFRICKFRSMVADAQRKGPGITAAGDPRITGIGNLLRRWKLDELPQLWNVLKGEMSMVGPRPELAYYVQTYTSAQLAVLSVRPGITDPASLEYRNEEKLLEAATDRERFYTQVVLPAKLALNLGYIQHLSFAHDIAVVMKTLKAIVPQKASHSGTSPSKRATNLPQDDSTRLS